MSSTQTIEYVGCLATGVESCEQLIVDQSDSVAVCVGRNATVTRYALAHVARK